MAEEIKARVRQVKTLPTVAIRGMTVFPGMHLHFEVSRRQSREALRAAMDTGREVFLITQRDIKTEEPDSVDDFYETGVVCSLRQILTASNENSLKVAVEGLSRAKLGGLAATQPYLQAVVREQKTTAIKPADREYALALTRVLRQTFEEYSHFVPGVSSDVMLDVMTMDDVGKLADFIAANSGIDADKKQPVLNTLNPLRRAELACAILRTETELLGIEEDIHEKVREQIDDEQREYYLREQLRVISEELDGEDADEISAMRDKILSLDIEESSKKKLLTECGRLAKASPSSPEAAVIRTYLETCLELPWNSVSKDNLDLGRARKILDADHYGLTEVKERMIEMLAVRALAPDITGQIICLVGPPGVGKTSVAKSVARAMGRKYERIALGGIRDEAEIRGHRKTYIGSMPGRIIEAVRKSGVKNPLILLDEIDKLGADYKGDPSSALLEVLDGEQNSTFVDHYIDLPFDLSRVLFVTTANDRDGIPAPLLDRMEIIELGSYTAEEKFHIGKKHLIPKQAKSHGLNGRTLRVSDAALKDMIDGYTREAGVRQLERTIASVCRKAAVAITDGAKSFPVKPEDLEKLIGSRKYRLEDQKHEDEIGVANGLAWTAVGGELLKVEAAVFDGSGKLELTGSLGDVMKESARAALSFIRANHEALGVDGAFYKEKDIHLHFPEGAVPKDGPSAGITIAAALTSALSGRAVRGDVAMTGEITVRGRVLPIGGLKEKSMAAYKAGMSKVLIPDENLPDLDKVDEAVRAALTYVPVRTALSVIDEALCK